eukprot:3020876-Pyramimonas_sp.AAC.1
MKLKFNAFAVAKFVRKPSIHLLEMRFASFEKQRAGKRAHELDARVAHLETVSEIDRTIQSPTIGATIPEGTK